MLPSLRRHGNLLVTYLSPQRSRVLLLAALLLASIALQLANPQIVSFFINTAQSGGPVEALTWAAVIFLVVAVVQQFVALGATWLGAVVGWEATNRLRTDLMHHCLNLDLPFHKTHTPGELIERIDGDVTLLANFFSQFTINVLGNAVLVLGILVILARDSLWLGLGLATYCAITVTVLRALQRRAVARNVVDRQASAEQYGAIEERLASTEDIRGVGAEAWVVWRLLSVMQRRLRTNRSANLAGSLSFFSTKFLYVIAYAIGLALGAFLFENHQITLGTCYLIVFYIGMLAAPLDNIQRQMQNMQQASAGIGRVDGLLAISTSLPRSGRRTLPAGPYSVELNNVTFGYERGDSVLKEIRLSMEAGETLGLLGRTGSGKTTLARLLARLYDPESGSILLAGIDLREVAESDLRHRVGMVTQDVQHWRATVRDNLTFFRRRRSDADILEVLHHLELMDWFRTLPQGLDTVLRAGGDGLSAGQAQLLAFARVFLRDPGLVILDEATSRLDPATERYVERAVERLLAGRTGVVVAHRLRTIARVDRIAILEEGRIAEQGRRADLERNPSSRLSGLLRAGMEEVLA